MHEPLESLKYLFKFCQYEFLTFYRWYVIWYVKSLQAGLSTAAVVCSAVCVCPGGGGGGCKGTHIGKWYGDVPQLWPPFSRPVGIPWPSNLPSMHRICAPIFNFQPCFVQNFSSQDANFPNFHSPKTPHFSRKIRSPDPTFGNLCGTHPSAPPPVRVLPHAFETPITFHIDRMTSMFPN